MEVLAPLFLKSVLALMGVHGTEMRSVIFSSAISCALACLRWISSHPLGLLSWGAFASMDGDRKLAVGVFAELLPRLVISPLLRPQHRVGIVESPFFQVLETQLTSLCGRDGVLDECVTYSADMLGMDRYDVHASCFL